MTSANSEPTLPSFSPSTTHNRRPSYANVAAGVHPSRFNTLQAFGSGTTSLPQQHHQPAPVHAQIPRSTQTPPMSRQRSRSSLRSMEIDGQSWKRPGSSWSNELGRMDGKMGCPIHDEHLPFFTPSYLRHSRHVQQLHRAWDEHVAHLQESVALNPHPPRQPSLSASSSSANLSKMHAQHIHRGPVQDVVERIQPAVEEDTSRSLPSRWSEEDRATGLEVLADGTEVRFNGVLKGPDEAASVRADHYMPREVGIYYYEVTVLSRSHKGDGNMLAVGFAARKNPVSRLPGWEPESWAYHGDDGSLYNGSSNGKLWGPRFGSMDVIGCGFNFRTGNIFFTRNGLSLGIAYTNLKVDRLYPCVGLKKPGEHIRTNFGRSPFVFDINRMVDEERQAIFSEISLADVNFLHPPDDEDALIHKLVGQYLAHEGYIDTARAFAQDLHDEQQSLQDQRQPIQLPDADDDIHAANRQKIRKSILDGDIDKALKYTTTFYPRVLEDERNKDIHFRLRCRKFIEMMRRYTELSAATSSPVTVAKSMESLESNGHAENGEDETYGEEITDTQMELDDQLNREASKDFESPVGDVDMDASQELSPKISFMKQNDLLTQALAYGRELQSTFGADPRQQVKKQLSDIFAIMAYTNPNESVVGQLLDPQGRVQIAEEINGAILVSIGKPPSAALEKLCAQTEGLLDEAASKTGGAAAFVNVRVDFLQP